MSVLNTKVFTFLLAFLGNTLRVRLNISTGIGDEREFPDLILPGGHLILTEFVKKHQPNPNEFITLLTALAPHLQPNFFNDILQEYFPEGNQFPAIGGVRVAQSRTILPTGETVAFILGGQDIGKRLELQQLFRADHFFATQRILTLGDVHPGEPALNGQLILDAEWLERMTTGSVSTPHFGAGFPAEKLETQLEWKDLVLNSRTREQINELEVWLEHHATFAEESGLSRHIKPGYRALFHGPPGTGKTLTATLLGKAMARPVFRVDLSMVVSKYIGETEKNLAALFDRAANKDWILFFDEADALFGKRTEIRDARDKSANQETAFLLQRVEAFPGLVILATNFLKNLDSAFHRRFQSVVMFQKPSSRERLILWESILPKKMKLAKGLSLKSIAAKYELTGAQIVNIVQFCGLQMLANKRKTLSQELLLKAIAREFQKEGKLRA